MISPQIWYDSLRETDDGNFSSTVVKSTMDYHQRNKSANQDLLPQKLKSSSFMRHQSVDHKGRAVKITKVIERPFNS